jgi:hypothetical protein
MKKPSAGTGFRPRLEQGCPPSSAVLPRSPGTAWITDEAIADTRQVWSPYYGRELTDAEAVEILVNVRDLAEVLVQVKRKR